MSYRYLIPFAAVVALVVTTSAAGGAGRPVQQIVVGSGLTVSGGGNPDPTTGTISLGLDTSAIEGHLAGDFIRNGTSPQNASFNVTGTGAIGAGAAEFTNKLRIAGGNWNPNDSDTDILVGNSLYRLKLGVAIDGAGAGDVRLRAQGGTNRMMLGGGGNDTLTITPDKVGIGTITPDRALDVTGDAQVGQGLGEFTNKLWIAGGNWNPDDSDTDVLVGNSLFRLKMGVAIDGAGAGDVRLRAQGGTNRMMLGGGTSDTLTITPSRVGIGTITPDRTLDVTGNAQIGQSSGEFTNKLWIAGGNWNPDDSDTDVLVGNSLFRLKLGVAIDGAGAGDVRLRAQGGTNRMMLGGGTSDTLTITPSRVGIGTITPQSTLDVVGDAHVSGRLTKDYAGNPASAAPAAYGYVDSSGAKISGTPNFSVSWSAGDNDYVLSVVGETLSSTHTITVTPTGTTPVFAMVSGYSAGSALIKIFDLTGNPVQSDFNFVVFKQ